MTRDGAIYSGNLKEATLQIVVLMAQRWKAEKGAGEWMDLRLLPTIGTVTCDQPDVWRPMVLVDCPGLPPAYAVAKGTGPYPTEAEALAAAEEVKQQCDLVIHSWNHQN